MLKAAWFIWSGITRRRCARARLLLVISLSLTACQTIGQRSRLIEQLPQPSQLSCCWQKLESIHVFSDAADRSGKRLLAISVRQADTLLVNFLSPEGQQLMTLRQHQAVYEVSHHVEELKQLPEYIALLGLYLSYSRADQWHSGKGDWRVDWVPEQRVLNYRDQPFMTLTDISEQKNWQNRRLELSNKALSLDIVLIEHKDLLNTPEGN